MKPCPMHTPQRTWFSRVKPRIEPILFMKLISVASWRKDVRVTRFPSFRKREGINSLSSYLRLFNRIDAPNFVNAVALLNGHLLKPPRQPSYFSSTFPNIYVFPSRTTASFCPHVLCDSERTSARLAPSPSRDLRFHSASRTPPRAGSLTKATKRFERSRTAARKENVYIRPH